MSGSSLPPKAWVIALSRLPAMGPVRLSTLLERWTPKEAWEQVCDGNLHRDETIVRSVRSLNETLSQRWRDGARAIDIRELWQAHLDAGVEVIMPGDDDFPGSLVEDPDPPAALFVRGSLDALNGQRVAIVGTRRCTNAGRSIAYELGHALATAGVGVCSGLALGIDAATHEGALAAHENGGAAPIGVVGTGLDVVYPRRHTHLWEAVASKGLLMSEYPLGTKPEPWRFPARNRLLAGLADVVVVVESHSSGGSLHTVEAALARDTTVMAVPGSPRSPASAGTNELLAIGCAPARDAQDVLVALGLDDLGRTEPKAASRQESLLANSIDDDHQARVLKCLGWEPATLEQLSLRSGLAPASLAHVLGQLKHAELVVSRGSWWERR